MSGGGGYGQSYNQSKSRSSSTQSSDPLSEGELQQYFDRLDLTSGGRLGTFAQEGTQPASVEQIQALGGLGATRRSEAETARAQALERIMTDPSLTIAQRQRSAQLSDRDYSDRVDAIAKEIEAAKTGLARENAQLTREDLALLAQIFFGGKGQRSRGYSQAQTDAYGRSEQASGQASLAS